MNKFDKLRFAGVFKDKIFTGPDRIILALTNICNLRCLYCWFHTPWRKKEKQSEKRELDFRTFKNLIDDCSEMGVKWVKLSGQGEPSLYTRIIDVINYIKNKNFSLAFFSNGTFDNSLLKNLSKADDIRISLSATNPESYKKVQSQCSRNLFQKVISNISSLTANKDYSNKPRVQINFVLNLENYAELPQIFQLAYELKIDYLKIVTAELTSHINRIKIPNNTIKLINTMFAKTIKRKYFSKLNSNVFSNYQLKKKFLDKRDTIKACYNGWYYAFINFEGNVTPCCNYNKVLVAGNLQKNSFKEIWYSGSFHKIRLEGKYTLFDHQFTDCFTCRFHRFNNDIHEKLNKFRVLSNK